MYKQTGSLGGALGAVLGDSTLSDLNTWQDAELEAPGPISYGPGFAIAHGALLSFAGLFTVINGVQSYLAQKSNGGFGTRCLFSDDRHDGLGRGFPRLHRPAVGRTNH